MCIDDNTHTNAFFWDWLVLGTGSLADPKHVYVYYTCPQNHPSPLPPPQSLNKNEKENSYVAPAGPKLYEPFEWNSI